MKKLIYLLTLLAVLAGSQAQLLADDQDSQTQTQVDGGVDNDPNTPE